MNLKEHNHRQIELALGPENRWYCSEFYGREITDPELLLEYFIKHGGSDAFAGEAGGYGAVVGAGVSAMP